MIETVARAIAKANGDEFANAFKSKSRWIAKRGMSGGRFREAVEPFQSDYLQMARAAIEAMREPTYPVIEAGSKHVDPTNPYSNDVAGNVWSAMITAALGDQP